MTCHIIGQGLFWGQMRLRLLLNSTDATTYWQKRAGILDKRQTRFRLHSKQRAEKPQRGRTKILTELCRKAFCSLFWKRSTVTEALFAASASQHSCEHHERTSPPLLES